MPAAFDKCRSKGGRIRTKTLDGGKYVHICYDSGGGHAGHVKKKGAKK